MNTTRKKKKKKRMRRRRRKGRLTEDQIGQEEKESDLEGRRKELRKKKKEIYLWNVENGDSSFKYSISM